MNFFLFSWFAVTALVVFMNILYSIAAYNYPDKYVYYNVHAIILTTLHLAASALMTYNFFQSGRWCL